MPAQLGSRCRRNDGITLLELIVLGLFAMSPLAIYKELVPGQV
jgi:hypothetical protein